MRKTTYFEGEHQTLEMVMKSREERAYIQRVLLTTFKAPVVSYKLNMVGPVKYSPELHQIFDEGLSAFRENLKSNALTITFEKLIYENSGPEFFAVIDAAPALIKMQTIALENDHPLGRIFDFDVLNVQGEQLSRVDLGMGPRKCLICQEDALVCSRSRNHGLEALLETIYSLYQVHFQ